MPWAVQGSRIKRVRLRVRYFLYWLAAFWKSLSSDEVKILAGPLPAKDSYMRVDDASVASHLRPDRITAGRYIVEQIISGGIGSRLSMQAARQAVDTDGGSGKGCCQIAGDKPVETRPSIGFTGCHRAC